MGCSGDVDSLGGEVDGPQLLVGLEVESVLGDGDLDHLGEVLLVLSVGGDSGGQDDCVDGDLDLGSESGVVGLDDVSVVGGQLVVDGVPQELDSQLAGPVVELLAEGVGPDVLVDDGDVGHRVLHLDLDGLAQGSCAADTAAVGDVLGPGSDALDERDVLSVEGSVLDLLLRDGLGHDLGVLSVVVLGGLVGGRTDSEQDDTDGVLGTVGELELEGHRRRAGA